MPGNDSNPAGFPIPLPNGVNEAPAGFAGGRMKLEADGVCGWKKVVPSGAGVVAAVGEKFRSSNCLN